MLAIAGEQEALAKSFLLGASDDTVMRFNEQVGASRGGEGEGKGCASHTQDPSP